MARKERDVLEHAVRTLADQAVKADELVDEATAARGGSHPVTVHAKMLRFELLKVKADLERELEDFVLNCSKCRESGRALGGRSRRLPRTLGAPRARAARRARWESGGPGPRPCSASAPLRLRDASDGGCWVSTIRARVTA